jgi:hypothetical protein
MTNPEPLAPRLDSFLAELIDLIPADAIATISFHTARDILDATPDGAFRDALRDAFRDNIEVPDDADEPLI